MAFGKIKNIGIVHFNFSKDVEIEQCADCILIADFLCDYPVGNDKTCDRHMCEVHSIKVSYNMHYCKAHYREYLDWKNDGSLEKDKILNNIVKLNNVIDT